MAKPLYVRSTLRSPLGATRVLRNAQKGRFAMPFLFLHPVKHTDIVNGKSIVGEDIPSFLDVAEENGGVIGGIFANLQGRAVSVTTDFGGQQNKLRYLRHRLVATVDFFAVAVEDVFALGPQHTETVETVLGRGQVVLNAPVVAELSAVTAVNVAAGGGAGEEMLHNVVFNADQAAS